MCREYLVFTTTYTAIFNKVFGVVGDFFGINVHNPGVIVVTIPFYESIGRTEDVDYIIHDFCTTIGSCFVIHVFIRYTYNLVSFMHVSNAPFE